MSALALALALALAGEPAPAAPAPPAAPDPAPAPLRDEAPAPSGDDASGDTALDLATRCHRRGDAGCALAAADRALASLPGEDGGALRREALAIRAEACARLDRPADARAAFERLRAVWPGWQPAPDADPRVVAAWTAAQPAAAAGSGLDPHRPAGALAPADAPAPVGDTPDPPHPANADAPPPSAPPPPPSAPPPPPAAPRLRLALGAGLGLPAGADADRFTAGVQAALDFTLPVGGPALGAPELGLWFIAAVALLPVDPALPLEPGAPGGLTTLAAGLGIALDLPLDGALSLTAAAALGYGAFGLDRDLDRGGLALLGLVGVRWQADPRLALRVDAAPQLILAPDGAPGGHTALMLRGETRF